MGHLAVSDDFFGTTLDDRPGHCPESWSGLFGMGSTPTPDAGAYPSPGELRDVMAAAREGLVGWFQAMDDTRLAAPLPKDWETFAPNFGALMSTIAWHEGLHAGQLTVVRKSLGLAPKHG